MHIQTGKYDLRFDGHGDICQLQVRLLPGSVPRAGRGLESGVGSGRFAASLGIRYGSDSSSGLSKLAFTPGIEVVQGEGEHFPCHAGTFDYVLMMTVICFLEDPSVVVHEVFWVLVRDGVLIPGFIEKGGEIALKVRQEMTNGRFLRFARFLIVDEVAGIFKHAVFQKCQLSGGAGD
jgi:SAM-dependent methyltransferase